ncbi:Uncharacterized protein LAWI1_G000440 [Lachnellula willkommii]|uniref:Methyltransferase type 11 domain-containing protein n=1 Tax=Lachnellula willkommii TaxID=215461 RepID=A0A559MMJ8_9HELO|nr:Uncharacterized protein LAWI1_G000440 [Lachnellula willkommii]
MTQEPWNFCPTSGRDQNVNPAKLHHKHQTKPSNGAESDAFVAAKDYLTRLQDINKSWRFEDRIMAQNIYDDPSFFEVYIKAPRQVQGLDAAPEWPNLRAMIPDLHCSKFLDLGCGFGWTCRWARENGAQAAHGIDLSKNMLSKAKEFPEDPAITYLQADLDQVKLPALSFDVAFSSLALHYLKNLPELVAQVYQSLTPGGTFVFSAEHPIWTAPRNPGWILDAEGVNVWPLDRYLSEGPRITNWMAEGVIKQHRTIATYITILLQAGFVLSAIDEWGPTPEQLEEFPDWAKARDRPPFLLMKAIKPIVGRGTVVEYMRE